MREENNKKKIIKNKSFNYKWYQFLIIYGIINIYLFYGINGEINYIYKTFSDMHVTELFVDGSDFSIFANLLSMPIAGFLIIINIGFLLLFEFIIILLFRVGYFKSVAKDEEKIRLCQYIKNALICFILVNVICTVFWSDIQRMKLFVFLYLPVPFLTFIFIYGKMKKV